MIPRSSFRRWRPCLEVLHTRVAPAILTDFTGGILTITSDAASDNISITRDGPGNLLLNGGGITGGPTIGSTTRIDAFGNDGDDTVAIDGLVPLPASILGGNGDDSLVGSTGLDYLDGGSSNDTLQGFPGVDTLTGGTGDDRLEGGTDGDQYVFAADSPLGSDIVDDDVGTNELSFCQTTTVGINLDLMVSTQSVNANLTLTLVGGTIIQNVCGTAANDMIFGNALDNLLEGIQGNDQLFGRAGNDTYRFNADGNLGSDTVNDLSGIDTLDFAFTTLQALTVDLGNPAAQMVTPMFMLTLSDGNSIENAIGGALGDMLLGNALNNDIEGGPGNDTLASGAGNDTYGFSADDSLGSDTLDETGGGIDTLDFSFRTTLLPLAVDLANPGAQIVNANLTLTLSAGNTFENAIGGTGADTLRGNALNNDLEGGPGDDTLLGLAGDDTYGFSTDDPLGTDSIQTETSGIDTLDFGFRNSSLPLFVNLGNPAAQFVNANLTLQLPNAIENIVGGPLNDFLAGNDLANRIEGGDGDDTIGGGLGDDTLDGGAGVDRRDELAAFPLLGTDTVVGFEEAVFRGSAGDDLLDFTGLAGSLTLFGLAGNDTLVGTNGGDVLSGGLGDDMILGGNGLDTVMEIGDADFTLTDGSLVSLIFGNDMLSGIEQAILSGGFGNNRLDAADFTLGPVELQGDNGNDTLLGGSANDLLRGEVGDDLLSGNGGDDTVDGGPGFDFCSQTGDVNFTLTDTSLSGTGNDTLSAIEIVGLSGGPNANLLDASACVSLNVALSGGDGNDTLRGGGGFDSLNGELGDDNLDGGPMLDQLVVLGSGDFAVTSTRLTGQGTDTLSNLERVFFLDGPGDDRFDASAWSPGSVTLFASAGNDTLMGGPFPDSLSGGDGDDVLNGGPGDDILFGGPGTDLTLHAVGDTDTDTENGIEVMGILGTAGSDTLDFSGSMMPVFVDGGAGDDMLIGTGLNDTLIGGAGDNTLIGGAGLDVIMDTADANFTLTPTQLLGAGQNTLVSVELAQLHGGDGNNRFNTVAFTGSVSLFGEAGDDTLMSGGGNDSLVGGSGVDCVIAAGDNDFTLTDTSLAAILLGTDALDGIEEVSLEGGASANRFTVSGFTGTATLSGANGDDLIESVHDADFTLLGDRLSRSDGANLLLETLERLLLGGGGGENTFTFLCPPPFNCPPGGGTIMGGGGIDRIIVDGDEATLTDDLLQLTITDDLMLTSIDEAILTGTDGNDALDASTFTGKATLNGGLGNDTLRGGSGDDVLTGGPGNDNLLGGAGANRLVEIANGNLTLNNTKLKGVLGTDLLSGIGQASLLGGTGNDKLDAAGFKHGPVTLDGGAGNDTLTGTKFNDSLAGGAGNDKLNGAAGDDRLLGGDGNDNLLAGAGNDFLDGGLGLDTATGGAGTDMCLNAEKRKGCEQ